MTKRYQVMPDLSPEDYKELKADIEKRGVQVAVEYDEDGNILDGHHRIKACEELGIICTAKVGRFGLSEEQKREHARKLNMARRHLTRDQRQELIRQQLKETPEKSDRQIAIGLGVSDKTVGAQRKELESIAEIPQCDRQTSDGRVYPAIRQVDRKPITLYNPTETEVECAKELIQTAAPELTEAVAHNKVPLIQAHSVASEATPTQQVEALKRLETGEVPYLMEGINQQRMEDYLNAPKEQLQAAEKKAVAEDREETVRQNTDKAFSTIYEKIMYLRSDYSNIARCLLANPNRTQNEIVSDLNECIERLQCIKAAVTKTYQNKLRVVK